MCSEIARFCFLLRRAREGSDATTKRSRVLQSEVTESTDADHTYARGAGRVAKQWREYGDARAHQRCRMLGRDGVRDAKRQSSVSDDALSESTLSPQARRFPVLTHVVPTGRTLLARKVRA